MKKEQKKDNNKLYDFDYESKEEKKLNKKRKKADEKSASKKKKQARNAVKSNKVGQEPKKKKYDDEIIIGVTQYPEKKKTETKKKNNKKRRKETKNIEQYNVDKSKISDKIEKNTGRIKDPNKRNKIVKIILSIVLIAVAVIFLLVSPIFNIKNIEIIGNEQISKEEIKSLSGIQIDENIFKVNRILVSNNIKQNAYINEVQIHKSLPNTIQIKVTEREPSYMLEYGNGYVYVNNQGYMLEISSIKKELPILLGTSTSKEDYKDGNRLNEKDLVKLGTVIKIMDAAQTNEIAKLITKIDISDPNDYKLYLDTERKVAYLGDCSNLETRILFLVGIMNKEKENAGEIFINMNLNTENAYFRESV